MTVCLSAFCIDDERPDAMFPLHLDGSCFAVPRNIFQFSRFDVLDIDWSRQKNFLVERCDGQSLVGRHRVVLIYKDSLAVCHFEVADVVDGLGDTLRISQCDEHTHFLGIHAPVVFLYMEHLAIFLGNLCDACPSP